MKNILLGTIITLALSGCQQTTHNKEEIIPVPFNQVKLTDGFWKQRMETEIKVTVPFSVEQSKPAIERFQQAADYLAGKPTELPVPHRFISSDLYKVMEGVAYSLMIEPNKELEEFMDETIDYIAASQEKDGYIYISHTCGNPIPDEMGEKPYSYILHSHELYNVGHMYEAAVAYYQATGKDKLLNVSTKNARHINKVIFEGGDPKYNDGKPIMQAPGHEEIELALCKLYRVTNDPLYLDMAKKFLEIRGVTYCPEGEGVMAPTYAQQHAPVKEQTEAVGHAVRAAYLYTAMAQVDALTGLNEYSDALNKIWTNLVTTRMHITGGLGAVAGMEGFGAPYELPNLTAYNETCAAVANVFFNHGMYLASGDAKFLDIAELSLFNNSLAGINISGDRFFYVNPLEADGVKQFNHGEGGRAKWFYCACCPPNISRLILQVPGYMYSYSKDKIYVTLYGGSETTIPLVNTNIQISQTSDYPFNGDTNIEINPEKEASFSLYLRIPTWATADEFVPGGLYPYKNNVSKNVVIKVNNSIVNYKMDKGFAVINRSWKTGDVVNLHIPMPVRFVGCIPEVKDNIGKVAVTRGPLVYCAEEIDNDGPIQNLFIGNIDESLAKTSTITSGVLQGLKQIKIPNINLIPYYAWCNRGDDETMMVWLNVEKASAGKDKNEISYVRTIKELRASSSTKGDDISIKAICDGKEGKSSADISQAIWASQGSGNQWVEIDFKEPFKLNSLSIYWSDQRNNTAVPESWYVEHRNGNEWEKIDLYITDSYQKEKDKFNVIHPASSLTVNTLRIQIKAINGKEVGISEIRMD